MTKYSYDILNWNPINTNSPSLLTQVKIKPDVKLLELFKKAPLHNILSKITDTDCEEKVAYGKIDKDDSNEYYITLDLVWMNYPQKNGKIEFFEDSVYKTIDYITEPNASPIILPPLNMLYNDADTNKEILPNSTKNETQTCFNPRMKLYEILLPIAISFILIGLSKYIFPKKFFK